jgi:hypothetical protein
MPADPADTPLPETEAAAQGQQNERLYPRFACDLAAKVLLLRSGTPVPGEKRAWYGVRVVDVSEGGAQIQTPRRLSVNDLLLIELPMDRVRRMNVKVRVVHVRRVSGSTWAARLRFVSGG